MPDLKFNPKTGNFEVSNISVEDIAKLAGWMEEGHKSSKSAPTATPLVQMHGTIDPDYAGFKTKLTSKAKEFLAILGQNPSGINADSLADKLGFTSGVQLGGLAGGGLAKYAKDFHVDLDYVYTREKRWINGVREVLYKPGKYLQSLL